ncbi:MAG TPA: NfeD family protein [Vicinamibacterales bacterium]|nr:NfeD family protein [Vicinamibacterales bacterium]
MAWWTWCIVGVALLGMELFAVDAQFYLVFAGLAAVVVGLLGLVGIELPVWAQWLSFAALSLAAMFTIRRQLYEKLLSKPLGKVNTDIDQRIIVGQELAPGKSCRIEYRGTGWTAINVGKHVIPAGGDARIDSIEGLTLHVRSH